MKKSTRGTSPLPFASTSIAMRPLQDQTLLNAQNNLDIMRKKVEQDRLRLFVIRLEQIGEKAILLRQVKQDQANDTLELEEAKWSVLEKKWETMSGDARTMLSSWTTSPRKTFQKKVIPRFAKWSKQAGKSLHANVGKEIHAACRRAVQLSPPNDCMRKQKDGVTPSKAKRSLSSRGWECCANLARHAREKEKAADHLKNVLTLHHGIDNISISEENEISNGGGGGGGGGGSSSSSRGSAVLEITQPVDFRTSLDSFANFDLLKVSGTSSMTQSVVGSISISGSITDRSTSTSPRTQKFNAKNEVTETLLVVCDLSSRLEQLYTYYLAGQNEMTMRNFTTMMRDGGVTKKKKKSNKEVSGCARRVMKPASLDIVFVRVTQAQTIHANVINGMIEKRKRAKLLKSKQTDTSGTKTSSSHSRQPRITPPSLTVSSLMTRSGFIQGLLGIAVSRYGVVQDTNANNAAAATGNTSTSRMALKRSTSKAANNNDNDDDDNNINNNNNIIINNSSRTTDIQQLLSSPSLTQGQCLLRLLYCDLFPKCKTLDQARHLTSMNTCRVGRVLDNFDGFLQHEFARWAGAASNRGPLRDGERKISLREWTAFLGGWRLLSLGGEHGGATGSKRRRRKKQKKVTSTGTGSAEGKQEFVHVHVVDEDEDVNDDNDDVDDDDDVVDDGSALFQQASSLLFEESSSLLLGEQQPSDMEGNNKTTDSIQPKPSRRKQKTSAPRKSPRVLPSRPVRRLTIWEAKRIFTTALSRTKAPTFGAAAGGAAAAMSDVDSSNSAVLKCDFFSTFNSWATNNRRVGRMQDERNRNSDIGLTAKSFVEALCSVAVYQQPSPYYSMDESLEYLLQTVMALSPDGESGSRILSSQ